MSPKHTLYRRRSGLGYRLVMSSMDAGGGDDLRYKYLALLRYGTTVRRTSCMDSAATEAELDQWGEVITDEGDKAEILRRVTCVVVSCSQVSEMGRSVCGKHLKQAQPGKPAGRYRNRPKNNRGSR